MNNDSLNKMALLVLFASFFSFALQAASAQNFQAIHTFTGGGDGYQPIAGITIGPGGKLYGTASDYTGPGSVFQMTPKNGSWLFSTLATFWGAQNGAIPFGRAVFGPGGTLYGTNSQYGSGGIGCGEPGCGAVYSLRAPATICRAVSCPWTIGGPYNFTGVGGDGDQPYYVDPVFDSLGNLYGTTLGGGAYDLGIVFELTRNNGNWDESVLLSFNGNNGGLPVSGVILDSQGNIYGTTYWNVYKLTHSGSSWIASTLFNFPDPGTQGAGPFGPPLLDSAGNLYGTTESEGPGGGGTVFELSPSGQGWSYSVLYSFSGTNGGGPQGNVVMDSAGNLYGTTYAHGAYGYGSVWKLTRTQTGWDYTDLHDFTGGSDGANPVAGPAIDANGVLYGTTSLGGTTAGEACQFQGCGVVWSISQ
jgi:uncharacterized repeat protein (TIGR03803 family)